MTVHVRNFILESGSSSDILSAQDTPLPFRFSLCEMGQSAHNRYSEASIYFSYSSFSPAPHPAVNPVIQLNILQCIA